jgi:hypothetical protein
LALREGAHAVTATLATRASVAMLFNMTSSAVRLGWLRHALEDFTAQCVVACRDRQVAQ